MSISEPDENTFVLSDEIIDHINSFFPPPDNLHEKTIQAYAALRALIYAIGVVLCEIEYPDGWELTIKAVESSFAKMLKDLPAVRAETDVGQRAQSIH